MRPAEPPERRRSHRLAIVAFLTICIVWGTTFVAIRVAIETIPTLLVTGLRFLAAGLVLLGIAGLTRTSFPRRMAVWRDQVVGGVLMVAFGNSLVVYAEHVLTSGLAALLAATIPIWMAVLEWLVGRAPLTARRVLGLALGFGGVGLLVAPEIGRPEASWPFLLAVLAMQASALAWNGGTLVTRRQGAVVAPIASAVIQTLSGGIVVLIVAWASGERLTPSAFSLRSTAALAYLAIAGSVIAYVAYNYALRALGAGKVSSYAYVNPLVAVITGALLLGERVTVTMMASMVVIVAGVAIVQTERRPVPVALEEVA